MGALTDLVMIGYNYDAGLYNTNFRFKVWDESKYDVTLETLERAKETLESNVKYFAKNIYIDKSNSNKSNLVFRSGKNIVPNSTDSEWFEISFLQISNGKIWCYLDTHSGENYERTEIGLYDDLIKFSPSIVIDAVCLGIQRAFKQSFLSIRDN